MRAVSFNRSVDLRKQIEQWKLRNTQLGYRIVTSFGGGYTYDSKNKYLMLDQLFGTDLGNVTWPVKRNVRLCPAKDANILVMDVEGVSKPSVRDMDFERKAALLSLAVSDIIIFHFFPVDVNNVVRKFMLPFVQVTNGLLRQGAFQSK
ncbi:hypothetical protein M378DRAFT_373912 [Amanita muscaria Koide BX008]|uniref:Uncharacterized protein n=1 Tax=Amanita muscaria (strain Koide BX008) TaxID=946122 RepID=A0A0C2WXZ5_AMAMK|nr:hypothetical protein M378DRAFT_373912 [Amanita muscaria Koide BX008]